MNMTNITVEDLEEIKAIVKAVFPDAKLGRTFYKGHHFVGITTMSTGLPTMLTDLITLDHENEEYEIAVWANALEKLVGSA